MVVFPHCKINLGLHVLSKRKDGFHNIETCFYPVPRFDVLEAIEADTFSFDQSGISIPGVVAENLCVRAFTLLQKDFDLKPVKIHLHKVVPLGAGLGGGSSDAAFMLQLLNDLFQLSLSEKQLMNYASLLGSDCTFFIQKRPMLGVGRGEKLEDIEVNLSGYWLCLIKPEVHVSTAEAYAGITPRIPEHSVKDILAMPTENWKLLLVNYFEESIFPKFPILHKLKEELYSRGAVYSAMSGSGSTIFGVFKKMPSLKNHFKGIDYWEGELK
jgi:4-diphosphocytidyl-2-C-methyl-D-erythritol kinase